MKRIKALHAIAVIASVMSVLMYVSYIPQIYGNLHGEKRQSDATISGND